MKFVLIIILYFQLSIALSKENKLFWNGHDWNMPNISSAQDWDNGPDGVERKTTM